MLKLSYPQGLNRYSYVFNNPLRYTDPTGNWLPWDQIKEIGSKLLDEAEDGMQVAQTKYKEIKQQTIQTYQQIEQGVIQTYREIKQVVEPVGQDVVKTVMDLPGNATIAVGVESTSRMTTSLVQDVLVIDVQQGSFLDKILPDPAITLYPFGVFTNEPMSKQVKEEEGFHWKDVANAGIFVPLWYKDYVSQYAFNYVAYGFNKRLAHNAVSYERAAMSYAAQATGGTYNPPPSIFSYWWNRAFGP